MGKRKIEIEKIENRDKRYVTFSKRRKGLFKKAAAACKLYGSEIAIVVFSPAGKLYSFGHSSVDSVIDQFLINNKFNNQQQQRSTRTIEEQEVLPQHGMMIKMEENPYDDQTKKDEDDEVTTTEEMVNTTTNLYLRDGDGYSWPSEEDWNSI